VTAGLRADVAVRRGDFHLDVSVTLTAGSVLAVLGPNGSGKSTLLNAIAGQIRPDFGRIEVGNRVLSDDDTFVAVADRRVGLLGQDPLLFPHLSALENVSFGQLARGVRHQQARSVAAEWLGRVGLTGLEDQKPASLSGGQQQRVAIARALAAKPDLLLLDEPMAALDVETASAVRTLLREHLAQTGVTTIVVTHDVADAIVLADQVMILQDGRIADAGGLSELMREPATEFTASLVGLNLVRGVVRADGAVIANDGRCFRGVGDSLRPGAAVSLVFPPTALRLQHEPAARGTANHWSGTVAAMEPSATGVRIRLAGDRVVAELPAAQWVGAGVTLGSSISLAVDASDVVAYASARSSTR